MKRPIEEMEMEPGVNKPFLATNGEAKSEAPDGGPFELILQHIKPMGRWQITIFIILFVLDLFLGITNGSVVFMLQSPDFECDSAPITDIDNSHLAYNNTEDQCAFTVYDIETNTTTEEKCTHWRYDKSVMHNTVVTQWNLVCDQKFQMATGQTVYLIGFLVGSLISGPLSDRYGRRVILLVATASLGVFGVGQGYMPNFWAFIAFRLFYGASFIAISLIHYVMLQEITSAQWRSFMSGIFFAYALGYALLSVFAYLIRDWRHFSTAINAPLIPIFFFMWLLVPESPRWLLTNKKYEEADKVIQKAARMNGTRLPKELDIAVLGEQIAKEEAKEGFVQQESVLKVLRNPVMLWRLFDIGFCWIANNVVYYGLMLNVKDFLGDLFVNNAIYGIMEAPSYVFVIFASKWSRKNSLCICMLVAGFALFIVPWVENATGKLVLGLVGKFAITSSYALVYLYTGELFPTNVRCSALGVCSIIARIGAIIAPYVAFISTWNPSLYAVPFFIYGLISVISGILTLILPETAHEPLPETLEKALAMRVRFCGRTVM